MRNYRVLILNAAYYPHNIVPWQKAFDYIFEDKGYVVEEYEKNISTVSSTFKIPSVVVLKNYSEFMTKNTLHWSKPGVITRDKHMCAYCGEVFARKQLTVDHIIPKSRFNPKSAANTWMNTISSCFSCNSRKKQNRTPEEAGMHLLFQPYEPKYTYEYFAEWNTCEVDITWLPYIPKPKNTIEVHFDGQVDKEKVKFGRKVIR